jgi:hypothetical protein
MTAPVVGLNCEHCVFFERTDPVFGECRRHAPQPNSPVFVPKNEAVGTFKNDTHWPKVYLTSWCGQFSARKKSQEAAPPEAKTVAPPPSRNPELDNLIKLKPAETE